MILAGGAWSAMLARRHGVDLPQLLVKGTVCATEKLPEIISGQIKDDEIAIRRREDGSYTLALPNVIHTIGPDSFRNALQYLPLLQTMPDFSLALPSSSFHHPNSIAVKEIMSNWQNNETSPFETTRVLNPTPDSSTITKLQHLFSERFPELFQKQSGLAGLPKIQKSWAGMIDAMPDVVPVIDRVSEVEGLIVATGMSAHGFGIGPGFGKAIAHMTLGKEIGHDMYRFRSSRFKDGSEIVCGPGL